MILRRMMTLTRKCLYFGFQLYCVCITGCYNYGSIGSTVKLFSESADRWENTDITLTCSYNGQILGDFYWTSNISLEYKEGVVGGNCTIQTIWLNNTSAFSYKCTNDTVHSLTLKNITQNRHGEIWRCANDPGTYRTWSNILQIFVQVPVKSAAISSNTDILTTAENITFSWQCTTSKCRPAPRFLWYKRFNTQSDADETVIRNVSAISSSAVALESYSNNISIRLDKAWNGWYLFCGAQNRNDDVVQSRQILINVTYPPDGSLKIGRFETGETINVIKGRNVSLECSVSGGNPLPTLKWNEYDDIPQTVYGIVVTKTIAWRTSDIKDQELRCESIHQHKNDTTFVIAHVLFPPDTLEVALNMSTISKTNIQHFFSVIENASGTMALTCSARSNPSPSSYWWTGPLQSNSARLELNTTRHVRGTYTCNVNNTMIAYDGHTENGYIGEAYTVEILQPPTIGAMQDYEVVEGNDFNIDCPIISGNDSRRSVKWLTNQNVLVGQNESLSLKNVTRFANGTYTCQLDFIMEPTYSLQKNDTLTKGFYLAVLYKAEILSLSINTEVNSLTVNESARVHLTCNVDSNPSSTIEIQFRNKSVSKKSNTRTLDYIIPAVNCNDTGTYVCSGNNTYNNGQPVRKDNTLFVICSPRQTPSLELKQRVIAALNDTATFYFTTMAYPLPSLQWYRVMNESEITEEHGGVVNTYSVSTNEMQSNFTLDRVKETQYGEYLLKINNQYGTFNQEFYLVAEGKPNPPIHYNFFPDSVTSGTVTIWWEPGFDGGLPQSFIISYNITVSKWYNESAISHNKERRMNKTITGLVSSSVYHVLIYAQNKMGAVRVQHAITINTKELQLTENQTKPKVVGPAVGGTVGGLLAVITVTVSLVIVSKRKTCKRTSAQNKACDLNNLHTYQNLQKDGQSSSEGPNSAVYERLHHTENTEPDQQYQQLATFTETDAPNQKIYENLKLSQLYKENNVGESSGSSQNTSAHNQRPV